MQKFSATCLSLFLMASSSSPSAFSYGYTYTHSSTLRSKSTFTGNTMITNNHNHNHKNKNNLVMYDQPGFDPSRRNHAQKKLKSGFWVALDHTEHWISQVLASSTKENPHARKEVTYDCELNQYPLGVIAGIFRRYKESRQLAQRYEHYEKQHVQQNPKHKPEVLKRTQVMILPFCEYFDSFESYEKVIKAINCARKNALDLVTDVAIENAERRGHGGVGVGVGDDWKITVNGASLHPEYSTPKEVMDQMMKKNSDNGNKSGEVDGGVNDSDQQRMQMERKNLARQSPYPTLIVEVKAEPQDPQDNAYTVDSSGSGSGGDKVEMVGAMSDVVQRLESIFAKSAAMHEGSGSGKKSDDIFYNTIGYVSGIQELEPPVNVMESAKKWLVENDPRYNKNLSTFLSSDLRHADSAYEFVFLNLSLHKYSPNTDTDKSRHVRYKAGTRSYLVLPKFTSSSATSFDKFADDVTSIIRVIDGLSDRVKVTAMHPEHIEVDRRSPSPVLILQWFDEKEE